MGTRDALGIRAPEPPAQSSVKKAPWADLASQKATQVTSLRDIQFATAQVSRLEQEQQRGAAVKATPALPRAAPAPAPATAPAPVIQGPPKPAKTAKVRGSRRICVLLAGAAHPTHIPWKVVGRPVTPSAEVVRMCTWPLGEAVVLLCLQVVQWRCGRQVLVIIT